MSVFNRRPNPYAFGVPVQEYRRFYGRRQELYSLLSPLASRRSQNVLLRGARRMGKTSILYMLKEILEDHKGLTGARGWFSIPHEWYPMLDQTLPIIFDLQSIEWRSGAPTSTGFYQALLSRMGDVGLTSEPSEALMNQERVGATMLAKALSELLREHRGVHPVVLVDEFDVLDQVGDRHFYGSLRHVIGTVQGITWIVASALGLFKELRSYESPLFNVFKIVSLAQLERGAAKNLILDPWRAEVGREWKVENAHLPFEDSAAEIILDETGCYPYFVQLLCSEIVDFANIAPVRIIGPSTVYQAIERIVEGGSTAYEHFSWIWDSTTAVGKLTLLVLLESGGPVTSVELEQAVIQSIADAGLVAGPSTFVPMFTDSLSRLQAMEVIRREGGRYDFAVLLFRRVLAGRSRHEALEEAALMEYAATTNG
jgi:hypothetical protein